MIALRNTLILVFFGVFSSTIAFGDTFQCRDSDNKISISNIPCPVGTTTEKIRHYKPVSPVSPQTQSGAASNSSRVIQSDLQYLDKKIDEAIKYDLRVAKQLALTPEHWRKIRAAEEILNKPVEKTSVELQTTAPQQSEQTQPQMQQQQVTQHEETFIQQQVLVQGGLTSQQQLRLQQLQQQKMQQEEQKQRELQKIQQQVIQQQQQRQQQVRQQRHACLSQVHSQYQNQRASLSRSMEGAGMKQSSMLTVLDQNFARDSALCNSIK